ncbi:hypothetical protein SAMN04489712_105274 [Thermomonospora echinospora]|uniref:Uncharacterized protein n=1 Tax=Thermomonospora echinospora TaxID=1992 RepID=A0A1H6A9W7_9ACTN|nr:hypothetical protein [Thermomonospora echinospora]SEG44847.1 hypothetical protein SAMN04489712_105274 [Thermomonospora echinospora]
MADEPQTEDPMVAALLRERAGYVQRGLDDRVAAVDEQLKLRGHTPPDQDATLRETDPPRRRTRPKSTTAKD